MKTLLGSYAGEVYKLRTRKKYTVFLVIGVVICLLWSFLGNLVSGRIADIGGGIGALVPPRFVPLSVLPFFTEILLPLLLFMGAADLFTTEAADSTIKASLLQPASRLKLYTAKHLAIVTYAAVYLGTIFFAAAAIGFLFSQGMTPVSMVTELLSFVLTLFPLAVLICFACLIAQLWKSGTFVMLILMFSYLLLKALPLAVTSVPHELFFTSYLGWYKIWVGILPGWGKILHVLFTLFGYGAVFFIGGSLLFEKKDF